MWPNFGNNMRNICKSPIWVIIWEIFVRAQNNLWGLYEYIFGEGANEIKTCGMSEKLYLD